MAPLVRRRRSAYLNVMAQQVTSQQQMLPQSRSPGVVAWGAAVLAGIVLLGALALWFHYGTAVFFEMIASGVSACF